MNVKKILFPFSNKEFGLKNYWWHRLFSVVFFVLLISTPIFVFLKLSNNEIKSRTGCLSFTEFTGNESYYNQNRYRAVTEQQMQLEKNKSSFDVNFYNAEQNRLQKEWDDINKEGAGRINNCFILNPIHYKLNLSLALLSAVLLGYLLQIVYYKILLYVVFGSDRN